MSLYENWIRKAYDKDGKSIKKVWDDYLPKEERVYRDILSNRTTSISGTLTELSERFDMPVLYTLGFIDGINEAIEHPVAVNDLDEDTHVDLNFEFEKLFKKMVQYKAHTLYTLPEWNDIFDEPTQKSFIVEQRKSGTVVRDKEKIGRNELCYCGSGKKFKKCCGAAL